jgi:hypothetical protein
LTEATRVVFSKHAFAPSTLHAGCRSRRSVTVAKPRLPKQDIGSDDNPWRVTEAHRPLGGIMRARKEAYRQSSILRHEANHQVRKEPKNLAEVFGAQQGG